MDIINKRIKPKPSIAYDTYWKFAYERQEIFNKRANRELPPWTKDAILKQFKFTNVYRATDRVSQYLITKVIYDSKHSAADIFFRILLFKLFNKIETWELLSKKLGPILHDNYTYTEYDKILGLAINAKEPIYSGAYIMASGESAFGYKKKHQNHLKLIEQMIKDEVYNRLQDCKKMQEVYEILRSYPTIGNFLSYQFSIDINYSTLTNFSEMDFVKAGPGAVDGILKCFSDIGEYTFEDIISMMAEKQVSEFERLELPFKNLWGRPLQLIDCQNIFCEVSKYSRVAHPDINSYANRKRIKQKYTPRRKEYIKLFFPPKWNINHLIVQHE